MSLVVLSGLGLLPFVLPGLSGDPTGNIVGLDRPLGIDQEDDIITGLGALMGQLEVFESFASATAW